VRPRECRFMRRERKLLPHAGNDANDPNVSCLAMYRLALASIASASTAFAPMGDKVSVIVAIALQQGSGGSRRCAAGVPPSRCGTGGGGRSTQKSFVREQLYGLSLVHERFIE
jgi:hypothetical protein